MTKRLIFACCMILLPGFAPGAATADKMQDEIDHLLAFVERTRCGYERNGKNYNGAEAAAHIRKKYAYFRDKIDSTEKFIELSASKSTMSGKYYMIYCESMPAKRSQQWLLEELQNFRDMK